jgi:hypothetical protein
MARYAKPERKFIRDKEEDDTDTTFAQMVTRLAGLSTPIDATAYDPAAENKSAIRAEICKCQQGTGFDDRIGSRVTWRGFGIRFRFSSPMTSWSSCRARVMFVIDKSPAAGQPLFTDILESGPATLPRIDAYREPKQVDRFIIAYDKIFQLTSVRTNIVKRIWVRANFTSIWDTSLVSYEDATSGKVGYWFILVDRDDAQFEFNARLKTVFTDA